MYRLKTLFCIVLLALLAGCGLLPSLDDVLPDQRDEYRSARDMPPLEVPPDLTTNTISENMAIPGDNSANTLSGYEQQQASRAGGSELGGALANEQTLVLRGDRYAIWPELKRFWTEQGYELELDDAELGVLETAWSEPRGTAGEEVRDRFKVFAEPGNQADTTVLFISHDLQRRLSADEQWQDAGSDAGTRQRLAAEMNTFFGGSSAVEKTASRDTGSATRRSSNLPRAEIINNDKGQVYMSLPNEFEQAWPLIENAMVRVGMQIRSSDAEAGEYMAAYKPQQSESEKGWFDSLKFWSSDEPQIYRVSVTPADQRTELVLRDEDGEWLSGDGARNLLYQIQQQYNQ